MDEILRFVTLANSGRFTGTDLCEQFGISRKTGYKHLERYAAHGLKGLQPQSYRPHASPQRTKAGWRRYVAYLGVLAEEDGKRRDEAEGVMG